MKKIFLLGVFIVLLGVGGLFFLRKKSLSLPKALFLTYEKKGEKFSPYGVGFKEGPYLIVAAAELTKGLYFKWGENLAPLPSREFLTLPPFPLAIRGGKWKKSRQLSLDQPVWVIGSDPKHPYVRGVAARRKPLLAQIDEAPWLWIVHTEQTLSKPYLLANAHFQWLGFVLGKSSEKSVAALDLSTMVSLFSENLPPLRQNAWALYLEGLLAYPQAKKTARDLWQNLAQASPPFPLALASSCRLLIDQKDWPRAEPCLLQAIAHFPEVLQLQSELAELYEEKGDFKKALAIFEKVQRKKPSPELQFHMALLNFLIGDLGKTYDLMLALKKNHLFYSQVLESMLQQSPQKIAP